MKLEPILVFVSLLILLLYHLDLIYQTRKNPDATSYVTRQINLSRNHSGMPVWQRNYFEHVIRNETEMDRIRQYIINNPVNWDNDENNPAHCMTADF